MKEILRVERKRILNLKSLSIIILIVLVSSIFSTVKLLGKYNIYDSSGKLEITSKENLSKSKGKENIILDEKAIKDVVDRKDSSKYLYNSGLTRLVSSNYVQKKLEDVTEAEIDGFYNIRIDNLKTISGSTRVEYTKEELKHVVSKGESLKTPLKVGYAEGWKTLNNEMVDFITIILVFISILVIPVFAEDQKTKMRELYISSKHGKKSLIKYRIVAGIQVGAILYSISILVFSCVRLIGFGVKGYNLPIQNSIKYFLTTYNITYLEQFLINMVIGFIAMLVLVSLTYLFTVIVNQILSGAVLVAFSWIIMATIPVISFRMQHYFNNFLPYNMVDFNNYYKLNEVYTVLGEIIPSVLCVSIVGIIIFLIFTLSTMLISNSKLLKKLS